MAAKINPLLKKAEGQIARFDSLLALARSGGDWREIREQLSALLFEIRYGSLPKAPPEMANREIARVLALADADFLDEALAEKADREKFAAVIRTKDVAKRKSASDAAAKQRIKDSKSNDEIILNEVRRLLKLKRARPITLRAIAENIENRQKELGLQPSGRLYSFTTIYEKVQIAAAAIAEEKK